MLLYEKNGYYTLTEASLITDFYSLSKDMSAYSLACYLCDAASAFAMPNEDSGDVLRLLLNSLYALEKSVAPIPLVKAAFELRLCSECGFYPIVDECADCGDSLNECEFYFHIADGISLCRGCSGKNSENILVTPSVAKAIKHITESDLSKFLSFRIGEPDMKILSFLAERYILLRAERGFKTLSFYKHCEDLL